VYAADGAYCNDDSTATLPPPDSMQFRFPSLVTPASGEMCTGMVRTHTRCKPEAECWPDQDNVWFDSPKENETYSDYAYQSYLVLDGVKCESAEVLQYWTLLICNAHIRTLQLRLVMLTARCFAVLSVLCILHTYCYHSMSVAPLSTPGQQSSSTDDASDAVKAAAAHFTQGLHRAGVPVRVNGVAVYPAPVCGTDAVPGNTCGRTCSGEATYNYQGLCPDRLVSSHSCCYVCCRPFNPAPSQ
jgi:hypothetical protein